MNANYTEEKLLFDILQELKEINQKLTRQEIAEPEPARPIAKATEVTEVKREEPAKPKFYRRCKKCGAEFDNYGYFMRHMKEHRKDGV